jgi:hypothetical protein
MKGIPLAALITLVLFWPVSCGSGPETGASPPPPPPEPEAAAAQPAAAVFDPSSISKEVFDTTKEGVQHFIDGLNQIIRNKNYNAWKDSLAGEYFAEISSADYLTRISDSDAMKSRKIVLKTAQDYFTHVVVPARASSRVDDIEFITENRVKAFTIAPNGQRLRLYDLEKSGSTWKIVN